VSTAIIAVTLTPAGTPRSRFRPQERDGGTRVLQARLKIGRRNRSPGLLRGTPTGDLGHVDARGFTEAVEAGGSRLPAATIAAVEVREFFVRATAFAGSHLLGASERLRASGARVGARTLAGDREIEWTWTLAHVRRGPGRVLDFGSGNGMSALGARFAANDVVAVDLLPEEYPFSPHGIEYVRGDFNELEFDESSFDQILNCSSIEHVGLAGRYGSPDEPDGDLRAMEKMARLLKPGGDMVLTIPVGLDAVHTPYHRIYGDQRLPRLLERWEVREESFWSKPSGPRFEPVSRERALAEAGSASYYSLGLFVVTPR
jgi:SAM-dependent methyltransferase